MALLGVCLVAASVAGCSHVGASSLNTGTVPPTVLTSLAPTAPPTTAQSTDLTVAGYSPGVNQPPFYPNTTISSVSCGSGPGGGFVLVNLPAGPSGTPAGSALAEPTVIIIVPGKAELKDHTGKVLYNEVPGQVSTGRQGTLVLSMVSTTYIGGDGRTVEQGAVDVSGNFACPATSVPFPGF